MSAQSSDWGDMVLPGVYMIRRGVHTSRLQQILSSDGHLNLELVHLEVEELTRDIERLTRSNEEIVYYLSHKEEYKGGDTSEDASQDCSMAAMLATSAGETVEEDDDEVFRDAIQENESVIKRKEAELALLYKLIANQKCGCHAHKSADPPAADTATVPQTENRTNAEPAANEDLPANRIVL